MCILLTDPHHDLASLSRSSGSSRVWQIWPESCFEHQITGRIYDAVSAAFFLLHPLISSFLLLSFLPPFSGSVISIRYANPWEA